MEIGFVENSRKFYDKTYIFEDLLLIENQSLNNICVRICVIPNEYGVYEIFWTEYNW